MTPTHPVPLPSRLCPAIFSLDEVIEAAATRHSLVTAACEKRVAREQHVHIVCHLVDKKRLRGRYIWGVGKDGWYGAECGNDNSSTLLVSYFKICYKLPGLLVVLLFNYLE